MRSAGSLLLPVWVTLSMLLSLSAGAAPLDANWRYAEVFNESGPETLDYLLGLGAYQKIHSRWRLANSEVIRGELTRVTWQVQEGFTADEGYEWYLEQLPEGAELLFECRGRACGSSAQWANRGFEQRILYGHDDRQRYSVWRVDYEGSTWTLVLYGVDRANRRHFIHLDRLRHTPD